MSLTVT